MSNHATAPLLQVQGLNAWYGAAQILFDVSLQVGRGEVVALMGRNGAGKSTTLKALMGMVTRRGSVQFLGQDIARREPHEIARLGLGYVPEERRMGVLFTEHSMDVVFGQADRVLVLVRGRLLAEGTPEQIQADARVQEAYLGAGFDAGEAA